MSDELQKAKELLENNGYKVIETDDYLDLTCYRRLGSLFPYADNLKHKRLIRLNDNVKKMSWYSMFEIYLDALKRGYTENESPALGVLSLSKNNEPDLMFQWEDWNEI